MKNIILPSKLYYGIDSLNSIFDVDYGNVMILSDKFTFTTNASVSKIKKQFDTMLTKTELILGDDERELFNKAYSHANVEIPEAIIAIGDGKTLDCAAAVSKLTGVRLVCVVGVAPIALGEYDTLDLFLYKTMPDVCILDPCFINNAPSDKIAYEAMAMMTLALESYIKAANAFVKDIAGEAFCELYRNIIPSYTGEISAREKLLEGMYAAHTAYLNSFDYAWESQSYRLSQFFSRWGIPKMSSIALASSYLAESFFDLNNAAFESLALNLRLTNQKELAGVTLKDSIAKIKAKLTIPSVIKDFGIKEDEFAQQCYDLPDEDKDLYYRCYYGSFVILKRNKLNTMTI